MFPDLFSFIIPAAHAAGSAQPADGGNFSLLTMFGVFLVFMYFAIWRPQSKRAKEQQNLMSSLTKGDEVMTAGGMLGRISKLADQYITLTIANNVEILVQRSSVVTVLPKGTLKAIE